MAFNILIVDDSLPMRAVIKRTIRASGFKVGEVLEASSGVEAMKMLREQWFDLVLTDYTMPEMNGMELIDAMKKEELLSTIPVVVITTEGSQQKIAEFMEKGAADFIQKPFTPELIRQKLNRIMGEPEDGEAVAGGIDENLDF
jgi:two-component system chemotaxis response regulator CheY